MQISSLASCVLLISFIASVVPQASAQEWSVEHVDFPRWFEHLTDRYVRVDASGARHLVYGAFGLFYLRVDGLALQEELVDPSPHVGSHASLALNSEARPHAAYADGLNGFLRYAWKSPSGWVVEVADGQGSGGLYTSVALDPSDAPCIAYYDSAGQNLRYAHRTGSGWVVQVVDSLGSVGEYASMALDASGAGHIAYFERTEGVSGMLKHARWDGSQWVIDSIVPAKAAGLSIDLDSASREHITYVSASNNRAHAFWNGSSWETTEVHGIGGFSSQEASLVVDAADGIHLAFRYHDADPYDAVYSVIYAYNGGSGWSFNTVIVSYTYETWGYGAVSLAVGDDGTRHIGIIDIGPPDALKLAISQPGGTWGVPNISRENECDWCSLELTGDASPRVTYRKTEGLDSNFPLCYAQKTESGWSIETLDLTGSGVSKPSLDLDSLDQPHIGYYYSTTPHLRHALRDDTGWHRQIVDAGAQIGQHASLALDSLGFAHISYYAGGAADLKYAYEDDSGWHLQTVDSQGSVGTHTSLALDNGDFPHICYYDATNTALKYSFLDGAGWHVETVDAPGSVGTYGSLALDGSGCAHISYRDATNLDLKYAYRATAGWVVIAVDMVGNVGEFTSLAVDRFGKPHISYHDHSNGRLKYAYEDWAGWHVLTLPGMGHGGHYTSLVVDQFRHAHICYVDNNAVAYATAALPPATNLVGSLSNGQFILMWAPVPEADAYWIYGSADGPWFTPGFGPGYAHRLAVVPQGTTTWQSENSAGNPAQNWAYLILAVDPAELELCRSNRVGEFDFEASVP
ncbi:hypothetical protein JXA88_08235 [Candidatus Fermentibacteria bacterium]|nr:hypothetical protein [Candidatus Fermentibacteria bacterium]